MDFKSYYEELKRRKVFKTTIAYIAAAWIIAQITADVLPIFEIPPFIQQAIIIILILGFPAVLIFAWIYDVTPEGIRKTDKAQNELPEGSRKTQRLNAAIISLLSVAVIILLYDQFGASGSEPREDQITGVYTDTVQKSIVVLPFKNWSGDASLEYVSDGIADEITTNLQDLQEFDRVVAFREALKFKYSDIGLKQISDSLNVRYILDGSMQLSGNRIRVKVQLLDGITNEYFWVEDFAARWDANELFSLQSEVTRKVLEKLKEDMGTIQVANEESFPTDNTEAYNYYLKGLYQARKGSQQGVSRAIEFFEKDTMKWNGFEYTSFYKTLLDLKDINQALWNGDFGGRPQRITTEFPKSIYAFSREKNGDKVIVILNLSPNTRSIKLTDEKFVGEYNNIFANSTMSLTQDTEMTLNPWEYMVFSNK